MDLSPVILSIPLYFTLIFVELIYTYFKQNDYYRVSDFISNVGCGIGDQVVGVFAKIVTVGVYHYLYTNFAILNIPNTWYSFLLMFVLVDFVYYWVHRSSHEINFLWAGHVVHHQSEEYNLSVALRQSWFHKFFTFPYYLPLALIGFDTLFFVWALGLNLIYQFWIHTELVGKIGFLERILSTPSHHRVHHARNPEYIDKNHGGVFIIWDRMFGTYAEEKHRPVYGITTPLNSWNPLWANLSHWKYMLDQARQTPKMRDKFLLFIKPPGWRPDYLGGQMPIPEVDRATAPKFKSSVSRSLVLYTVYQFVLVLLGTSAFLFLHIEYLPGHEKIISALLIMLSLVNISLLFDKKRRYYWLEYLRLVGSLMLVGHLFQSSPNFQLILLLASFLVFVSLVWIISLGPYFGKERGGLFIQTGSVTEA